MLLLYSGGKSLSEIAKQLDRRKSTIHYHTRKAFGRIIEPLRINEEPTMKLGEFLGLFAADGCFYIDSKRYHYTLTITLSAYQMEYARRVSEMIERILGRRARITVTNKRTISIVLRGKQILPFLRRYLWWRGKRTHTIRLNEAALRMNRQFLRGVIRGLVAGDGSIYVPRRRISFGVVSKRLAEQYATILRRFGIPSKSYPVRYRGKRTLHNVYVTGFGNLRRFQLKIGLTDPAKERQLDEAMRR
ncbi:MAG: hypothetical protein LYZ66_01550 [Nitrososphaerales archaeon]|nr:hypothetical protein [Nitrososphaerales archaeon]